MARWRERRQGGGDNTDVVMGWSDGEYRVSGEGRMMVIVMLVEFRVMVNVWWLW